MPTSGTENAVAICMGVVIPDSSEAQVLLGFDSFLSELPKNAFQNGEPKGKLLDDANRRRFVQFIRSAESILLCPIILDLKPLAGATEPNAKDAVVVALKSAASQCKHETMRHEVELLARQFKNLSLGCVSYVDSQVALDHC